MTKKELRELEAAEWRRAHTVYHEGLPVAEVRIKMADGYRLAIIDECPLCGKKHTHGWPVTDTGEYSHRLSHCSGGWGSYFLHGGKPE
jgi:hypothetical protein